ncbi:COX15/CtaA family protein [Halomonas sp. YLGW01]|uniref:COX15/CtaA family protein n=1 Tax=Halomonas sp. YLGW01 TaxID=2773308 RepID=UPI001783A3FE|nr:COX15/CtaA family protein [Halomonas sp. YLGW01]
MSQHDPRLGLLIRLSQLGIVFTVAVILMGAFTRLMDAGLGCPDWPGCYGQWVVPGASVVDSHASAMPLDPLKAWLEMIHRYLATMLGGLVLVMLALGWPRRRRPAYPWRLTLGLLAVIALQGSFGAFTVTLKLWPQVVTLHLLGGLAVMLMFLWLHLRLRQSTASPRPLGRPLPPLSRWWSIAALLLVLQLALGGWTSSNYAGIACQGFPTCNGQWLPAMDWSEGFHLTQQVGPNYLHGQLHADARTTIHLAHRLGALALGVSLILLAARHWRAPRLRPWLGSMLAAYGIQAGLGIANVVWWLPLGLALAHTAGAVLLALTMALAAWQAKMSLPLPAIVHRPQGEGRCAMP